MQLAADLGVFVNDSCSLPITDGTRCAVLASVVYSELLQPGAVRTDTCAPCAIGALQTPVVPVQRKRRRRFTDLIDGLDEATARRVRQ